MSALMLSPVPNRVHSTSAGNVYTADELGIITQVSSQADVDDLIAQGCALLNPPPTDLLFKLLAANFNSIGDEQFTPNFNGKYRIKRIVTLNTSVNGMNTAVGGIYTAAAKGGSAIVANTQVYTGLTNALTALELTIATPNLILPAGTPLFKSLTMAQGAAATADIYVYGDVYD